MPKKVNEAEQEKVNENPQSEDINTNSNQTDEINTNSNPEHDEYYIDEKEIPVLNINEEIRKEEERVFNEEKENSMEIQMGGYVLEEEIDEIFERRERSIEEKRNSLSMVSNTIKKQIKRNSDLEDEIKINPAEEKRNLNDLAIREETKRLRNTIWNDLHVKSFYDLSASDKKYLEEMNIENAMGILNSNSKEDRFLGIKSRFCGGPVTKEDLSKFVEVYEEVSKNAFDRSEAGLQTMENEKLIDLVVESTLILESKGVSLDSLTFLIEANKADREKLINDLCEHQLDKDEYYIVPENPAKEMGVILKSGSVEELAPEHMDALRKQNDPNVDKQMVRQAKTILAGPDFTPQMLKDACGLMNKLYRKLDLVDPSSKECNTLKTQIQNCEAAISEKGVDLRNVKMACKMFGTEEYDKYADKVLREQALKPAMFLDHTENIENFYDRLGAAFDVDHNPSGSDINRGNIIEAAKVMRDLEAYKDQLRFQGEERSLDLKSTELHLNNIKKFMQVKGLTKSDISNLMECKNDDLKDLAHNIYKERGPAKYERTVSAELKDNDLRINVSIDIDGEKKSFEEIIPFDEISRAPQPQKVVQATSSDFDARRNELLEAMNKFKQDFNVSEEDLKNLKDLQSPEVENNEPEVQDDSISLN